VIDTKASCSIKKREAIRRKRSFVFEEFVSKVSFMRVGGEEQEQLMWETRLAEQPGAGEEGSVDKQTH
jgi:hypothetical protein